MVISYPFWGFKYWTLHALRERGLTILAWWGAYRWLPSCLPNSVTGRNIYPSPSGWGWQQKAITPLTWELCMRHASRFCGVGTLPWDRQERFPQHAGSKVLPVWSHSSRHSTVCQNQGCEQSWGWEGVRDQQVSDASFFPDSTLISLWGILGDIKYSFLSPTSKKLKNNGTLRPKHSSQVVDDSERQVVNTMKGPGRIKSSFPQLWATW